MTGPVQFTEDGYRKEIHLEILNLRNNSFQKVCVHHHYFTFLFLFYLSNNSQMLAFWGTPFYFGYQDFKSEASDFSFQRFNAGKLGEMFQLI